MPEITPEQREAAWQAIRKWTAAIGSGPQDPDYALDALIAEGWGPVADAEARGYRSGLEAALAAAHAEITEEDGVGTADMMVAAAIRALADKPKETPNGNG